MADFTYNRQRIQADVNYAVLLLQNEADFVLNQYILQIENLKGQGLSERIAIATVLGEINRGEGYIKTFRNRMKKVVNAMVSSTIAKPIDEFGKSNPKQIFRWELSSAEHCPDCRRMSGFEGTISEIRAQGVGLPREGATACNVGCRCNLVPLPV